MATLLELAVAKKDVFLKTKALNEANIALTTANEGVEVAKAAVQLAVKAQNASRIAYSKIETDLTEAAIDAEIAAAGNG